MNEKVKKAALDMLQEKSLDLFAKFPEAVEMNFDESKDILVISVSSIEKKRPKTVKHNDVDVPVVFELVQVPENFVKESKAEEIMKKYPGLAKPDALHNSTAEEAINPFTTPKSVDGESYSKWKARHKKIKAV